MDNNPVLSILQIAGGYCLSRCLHVVADLGVADVLNDTPQSPEALAIAVGANADALDRTLRLLSSHGVFHSTGTLYSHSPSSRFLRSDHPQSLRAFARMFGLPVIWNASAHLDHSIKTGEPAAELGYAGGFWKYLVDFPDAGSTFNAAMEGKAHGQVAAIVTSYDFSQFSRIGDIGGGRGHLLRAILESSPNSTGVLFDLPHVVSEVATTDRLSVRGGSFFENKLPPCNGYVIMEVIHDWGDSESVSILNSIREAALPGAKLILIEQIVPEHGNADWTKTLDIHMLALFGGRQRTRQQYATLFSQSGWTLSRVIDTPAGISLLEATLG